jgi:hypothetical protein
VTDFHPQRNMTLSIDANTYGFMPHPYFPNDEEVFAIEGGEAIIYQVRDLANNVLRALKVTKPSYRGEHIARAAVALAPYKHISGLSLGDRLCLTRAKYPKLIAIYPDLEYAILMPWLPGKTWAGFMLDQRLPGPRYTPVQAYNVALATAHALWNLEAHSLAHTDVAGCNVVLSHDMKRVELLDIEGLYMYGAALPRLRSQGSPGYQHRNLDQRGQCRPEGDRFAGAVLLTEMLTWGDSIVRAQTPRNAESLFQPSELQVIETPHKAAPRWKAVRNALYTMCPAALPLFDQAWVSTDLAQCPDFETWAMCLVQARR